MTAARALTGVSSGSASVMTAPAKGYLRRWFALCGCTLTGRAVGIFGAVCAAPSDQVTQSINRRTKRRHKANIT